MFKKNTLAALIAMNLAVPVYAADAEKGDMEEMVVTATLTARDSATSPAFTSVITSEEITRTSVNSLADLLRDTVGVNNRSDSLGRDEIQIRGMGGRYTLILVDGKRVSSIGALWRGGDFDYNSVPLGSIERVEIVRGPMAALYGSDAIGGVVNIITKAPSQEWHGNVNVEFRGVDGGEEGAQQRVNASISGALSDRVSQSLSVEIYQRDAWYRNDADDLTEVPGLEEKESSSLVSTTRIKLTDNQNLDVDLGYNNDERPYGRYSAGDGWADYREQSIERFSYGLTHDAKWGWGKSVVYLKQEDSEIEDYNSRYDDPQDRILEEQNTYFKAYGITELGINAVTAGIEYREQEVTDKVSYADTGSESVSTTSLFVQDEIAFTERLNLTLGGRLDDHELFGDHFTSKLFVTYALTDAIVLKGGISEAFKAPDVYQFSEQYQLLSCGGSCYIPGNPDLEPETSTNMEAGIEAREDGWHLSAVVFDNDVEDKIEASYIESLGARAWVNLSTAHTRGIELDGSVTLTPSVFLSGNYTHMFDAEYSYGGEDIDLENQPETQANLALNWQITDALNGNVSANYVGEQVDYYGETLPSYTRLDVTGSYEITDAFGLRFGIKNVTDVDLEEENESYYSRELGRNYYLSAHYSF
ncbi:TonB-dependent receptor domain-containing protein [Microbulbifer thermotolerans]|uniref:TonB-dependent receptor domain-containing protein n=1 Tax=Microbulbifer thermotolerans TaxID=252514 RepID=UPI00224A4E99|nr:TonB-dependent receptor [Microbulbifer thermotolerans]MCX2780948.1 TonB-dependent receptor [Microbulbifer thermotolerans]MCX2806287.1 TonB-dependent receptor [Microbulbifer thermotolerans]